MKKTAVLILFITLISNLSYSQFRTGKDTGPSYNKSSNNLILGFINPKNFTMNHSFNVSMQNTQYGSVSLTSYVNSMSYKFSEKLNISADVRVQYSPYASSGLGSAYTNSLQNSLNGISLTNASLNYKISDNAFINFQYNNYNEADYLNGYNNPYLNSGFNAFQNSYWR
ncbi:MAG TPA: hypothetical protein PKD83_03310 [Ignavibacteria bacterium]|nr:hypothetical protein [Ignavibacteria bacterium]